MDSLSLFYVAEDPPLMYIIDVPTFILFYTTPRVVFLYIFGAVVWVDEVNLMFVSEKEEPGELCTLKN